MKNPSLLEDLSYPGRTGGYIARITGKFMNECAALGHHHLFVPEPDSFSPYIICAEKVAAWIPVFEVPAEFCVPFYTRLRGVCGIKPGETFGECSAIFFDVQYTFRVKLTEIPRRELGLEISVAN